MVLYSHEHMLEERSLEWESCVEWDTKGARSMGTLFLACPSRRTAASGAADISLHAADHSGK